MISNRQKLILKAIVEEFIDSNEPVGSKVLTEKPYLDFSSATIRYDMQSLEELGYLEKTHTSSGRIPSEMGFKFYVENLLTRDEEVKEMYPIINSIIESKDNTDDKIKNVVNLISTYSGYMAIAVGASANYQTVKKMEVVELSKREAVLLIVTSAGQVQSELIDIPEGIKIDDLMRLIDMFDNVMYNHSILEITNILSKEARKPRIRQMVHFQDDVIDFLIKGFARFQKGEFYQSGITKIFNQPEFKDHESMAKILELIDTEMLQDALSECGNGLTVRIGKDNLNPHLHNCSIVSIPFYTNENAYGFLCVVGPVRMNYKRVFPLLEYAANGIGKLYRKEEY